MSRFIKLVGWPATNRKQIHHLFSCASWTNNILLFLLRVVSFPNSSLPDCDKSVSKTCHSQWVWSVHCASWTNGTEFLCFCSLHWGECILPYTVLQVKIKSRTCVGEVADVFLPLYIEQIEKSKQSSFHMIKVNASLIADFRLYTNWLSILEARIMCNRRIGGVFFTRQSNANPTCASWTNDFN